ncbi:hypothetical protein D3C75_521400 [compost metagenome]
MTINQKIIFKIQDMKFFAITLNAKESFSIQTNISPLCFITHRDNILIPRSVKIKQGWLNKLRLDADSVWSKN